MEQINLRNSTVFGSYMETNFPDKSVVVVFNIWEYPDFHKKLGLNIEGNFYADDDYIFLIFNQFDEAYSFYHKYGLSDERANEPICELWQNGIIVDNGT